MRDLNKVMLIGNLTRDPEIRTTTGGQNVASFTVATNRSWNDAQGEKQSAVEYVDAVAWGKLADIAKQILSKGRKVYVEGRLQTRSWEGQDGIKRFKTEIVVRDLIVLDRRDEKVAPTEDSASDFDKSLEEIFSDEEISQEKPGSEKKEKNNAKENEKNEKKDEEKEINIDDVPF